MLPGDCRNHPINAQEYATEGLRTLCVAYRDIPEVEYRQWTAIYEQAAATINGRAEALDRAAELIEKDMFLLGATAIEDKLQDGVPDTIHTLQMAGIKVGVIFYCASWLLMRHLDLGAYW